MSKILFHPAGPDAVQPPSLDPRGGSAPAGPIPKPYRRPELRVYGSILELTRGNAGSGTDAGPHHRAKRGGGSVSFQD